MFRFYRNFRNLFDIFSLFFDGIMISTTGPCFSILTLFDLVIASAILYPQYSPVLRTTFLEASNPLSNNGKNPFNILFCCSLFYRITSFLVINKQCQINFSFYFKRSTILISKCYYNFIKLSIICFQRH